MGVLEFKEVNCKNCYKCVRNCPVKSIEISGHQAKIIESECILCGNCTIVCPQHAKEDMSELAAVQREIQLGHQVICMLAPSAAAYFSCGLNMLFKKMKQLGFDLIKETAMGAHAVKEKYEQLIIEQPDQVWISSCCPVVNSYLIKHRSEVLPSLAPVVTPMQAAAAIIREEYPDAVLVFAGPCIAKKGEAAEPLADTDYVLTFEELEGWMKEKHISCTEETTETQEQFGAKDSLEKQEALEENNTADGARLSRFFPVTGGILKTMEKQEGITYLSIDGLDSCMETIDEIAEGKLRSCFIEMSACKGSCIGGASFRRTKKGQTQAYQKVISSAVSEEKTDFVIECQPKLDQFRQSEQLQLLQPTEAQIKAILKKMGKNSLEDELNCGMCGYENCRKKAAAVYQNRAEISMCLPFMMGRAESFSDKILNITPNAILSVDLDLKVQQMNEASAKLFGVQTADVVGGPVSRILDEFDFVNMMINDIPTMKKNTFLTEYNRYVEQVFLYDRSSSIIICIMKDISAERVKKNRSMKAKLEAANMADEIVEKQLRIVHEIASLLGETAAETKLAVADLKDTIMQDQKDE